MSREEISIFCCFNFLCVGRVVVAAAAAAAVDAVATKLACAIWLCSICIVRIRNKKKKN